MFQYILKGLSHTKCILLSHCIKLKIHRNISGISPNMWKLNKALLSNPWIKEEIRRETRKYFEPNEMKT